MALFPSMTSADTQTRTHSKTLQLQEKKKYTPTVVNDFFLKKKVSSTALIADGEAARS